MNAPPNDGTPLSATHPAPNQPRTTPSSRRFAARGSDAALLLAVWALLLSMSFIRAPIPAVNEPHYLSKARFWWDPAWCAGDFFLQSSNPHVVFYATIGWLTRFLSLPQTAFVGRVVALGLLAGGWVAATRSLLARRSARLAAAALCCLAMAVGNFSGEWLIGGVESKVFAYAAALWGAACWSQGRVVLAAALAAVTVAYHPVVGVWILIAAALAGGWSAGRSRGAAGPSIPIPASTVSGRHVAWCVLVCGTLPALLPAIPLVFGGDPEVARTADRLLLTQRVGHHTDPLLFTTRAYGYYAGLLLLWLMLIALSGTTPAWRAWRRFAAAALAIAAVGLVVGWLPEISQVDRLAPWRLWLLKFYPFRLADLVLPAAVALELARRLTGAAGQCRADDPPADAGTIRSSVLTATVAWCGLLLLPAPDANPSGMSPEQRADWIAVCHWLRQHTPPDAVIGCSNEDWAVKWFADRAEYVNFKDCPQDAPGIVEWWHRRQGLVAWSRRAKADGRISAADLSQLHAQTGIDALVVSRYGPIDAAPSFQQGPFRVYAVAD